MALKTDYKDDIIEGNRKYSIITGADGKSEILDETVYTQTGDVFAADDINATNAAVNRLNHVTEVTLTAAAWTGTAAPYTQTVSIAGVTADDRPDIGIIFPVGCTREQQKAINKAAGCLYEAETGAGTVTFRCTEKPASDFTVGLKGV